jgi:two-component system cell cycle response regulator DivK
MNELILIIEDQGDNRRIMRDLLTSAGYKVIEAVTGEAGVKSAETHCPDLILMDIQLPDFDGYEATRRIKANPALSAIDPGVFCIAAFILAGSSKGGCPTFARRGGFPISNLFIADPAISQAMSNHRLPWHFHANS